ncbi:uncharacterized protein [Hemitrygon akajei]|uniref:uncharacterized protein isoform X2 n=1 Tax=Hemitrygon akajei TaxID=2704970 RepID=UPI003BF958A6
MHPFPMKTENWKPLPVIPDVSLLTALLITVWTVIGSDLELIFTGNHWGHVSSRRWHGLESIDKSIMLSKRNGDEQMVQIPAGVEKLHVVAPTLQALLLIISIVTYIAYQVNSEKYCFLFSATKYEEFIKIIFSLFLISQIPVTTACDPGEYENNGACCSLCSPGSRVSKHCTLMTDTTCDPCTSGEYMEHPNWLEKCFKCKICDAGTPFNDTVCEKCLHGTFSSEASTTEECKNWTVCEMAKLKQVEPGSAEADVKCEKVSESNWKVFVSVAVVILLAILGGIVAYVLWKKHKHKTGNQTIQSPRNHNGDVNVMQPLTGEEKTLRDEERAE